MEEMKRAVRLAVRPQTHITFAALCICSYSTAQCKYPCLQTACRDAKMVNLLQKKVPISNPSVSVVLCFVAWWVLWSPFLPPRGREGEQPQPPTIQLRRVPHPPPGSWGHQFEAVTPLWGAKDHLPVAPWLDSSGIIRAGWAGYLPPLRTWRRMWENKKSHLQAVQWGANQKLLLPLCVAANPGAGARSKGSHHIYTCAAEQIFHFRWLCYPRPRGLCTHACPHGTLYFCHPTSTEELQMLCRTVCPRPPSDTSASVKPVDPRNRLKVQIHFHSCSFSIEPILLHKSSINIFLITSTCIWH